MKFSDTSISKLKPKAERYYLYDSSEPRLGIVVHPTGRMVFHVRMTINGRTRRITERDELVLETLHETDDDVKVTWKWQPTAATEAAGA